MTLDSMKEWLSSWGEGPSWSDGTGVTVPVTKESLASLISNAEKMRKALQDLKDRALNTAPGYAEFSPASAASIATICEDALEGV